VDKGGHACLMRLVAFQFSLCGDGRADKDLRKDGRDDGPAWPMGMKPSYSSAVDDVRGCARSRRHLVVEVFSWEDPRRYGMYRGTATPSSSYLSASPCRRESLFVYGHIDSATHA
jgi:hypothetical protein